MGIRRIAQITFHNALNCGAALQTFALQLLLEKHGYAVVQPDCNVVGEYPGHFPKITPKDRSLVGLVRHYAWWLGAGICSIGVDEVKRFRFWRFRRRWLHCVRCQKHDIGRIADIAVFGSDQIWNDGLVQDEKDYFRGGAVVGGIPKIAYGASAGDGGLDNPELKSLARNFRAISVREKSSLFDVRVLDPTLLLEAHEYERVAYPRRMERSPYLFLYNLTGDCTIRASAIRIARSMGLRFVEGNMAQRGFWRWSPSIRLAVSPDRVLAYIRDAECVITNSFHGTALSLIYAKPFLAVAPKRAGARIFDLLSELACTDRMVSGDIGQGANVDLLRTHFSAGSLDRLLKFRERSIGWLLATIESGWAHDI